MEAICTSFTVWNSSIQQYLLYTCPNLKPMSHFVSAEILLMRELRVLFFFFIEADDLRYVGNWAACPLIIGLRFIFAKRL